MGQHQGSILRVRHDTVKDYLAASLYTGIKQGAWSQDGTHYIIQTTTFSGKLNGKIKPGIVPSACLFSCDGRGSKANC